MRQNIPALLGLMPLALAAAPLLARRRWSFVAGACLFVAAALLLLRRADWAFVAAALGVVAWFWDKRNYHKSLIIEHGDDTGEFADGDSDRDVDEVDEYEDDDTTN
ncbi:MAG: hypothetical protein ABR563_09130 [Pyrinomonadaceae bacterium]